MSRRTPAPGSRTSRNCNRGLSAGREGRMAERAERIRAERAERADRLVESLPRLVFDEQGFGTFKPEDDEQTEALRIAAHRFRWGLTVDNGNYLVLCHRKNESYKQREHNRQCVDMVPQLHFRKTPEGMMAILNNEDRSDDLRHGLDILAVRYGWTVNHNGPVSYVHKPFHRKVA
jgi:hypothetical protein